MEQNQTRTSLNLLWTQKSKFREAFNMFTIVILNKYFLIVSYNLWLSNMINMGNIFVIMQISYMVFPCKIAWLKLLLKMIHHPFL